AEDRIPLNVPIKVRLKRPVFRPDEEVDFRDPATGQEYRKQVSKNEDDEEIEELVPLEMENETVTVTCTPGQLMMNTILPFPLRHSDEFLKVELNKKALS